jgi:CRP-like cAMP-binding protein
MHADDESSWNENLILRETGGSHFRQICRRCERVRLAQHQVLYVPGVTAHAAYFPVDCLLSVAKTLHDGETVEINTIGHDGMLGISELLGRRNSACSAVVLVPGAAIRADTDALREAMAASCRLRRALLRHVAETFRRMAQAVACNRLHTIEQRCARWLLESSSQVLTEVLPLTHEQLALVLGVRRPGLTACLGRFHAMGLIRQHRGGIAVIDRSALAAIACECYDALRPFAEHEQAASDLAAHGVVHRRTEVPYPADVPAES